MTAYCGLTEVGLVKPDDTVVISGAAGATGGAAVQIAKKLFGCKRVIGIAGGPEKVSISSRPGLSTVVHLTCCLPSQCAWVKKLGADECLDYRSSTFNEDLVKATDGYVNVYFDNVRSVLRFLFRARHQTDAHVSLAQVGGSILNAMFARMARFSRIIA